MTARFAWCPVPYTACSARGSDALIPSRDREGAVGQVLRGTPDKFAHCRSKNKVSVRCPGRSTVSIMEPSPLSLNRSTVVIPS
jgi:hypothetical protein